MLIVFALSNFRILTETVQKYIIFFKTARFLRNFYPLIYGGRDRTVATIEIERLRLPFYPQKEKGRFLKKPSDLLNIFYQFPVYFIFTQ